MGLKKSGVKKGNSRLQGSGLFGIRDKVIPTNHMENTRVNFPVPSSYEARKLALAVGLKAEYWKAQANSLIRQLSIR